MGKGLDDSKEGWRSGQRYSLAVRKSLLSEIDRGRSVREVAADGKVSTTYIYKLLKNRHVIADGDERPLGRPRKLNGVQEKHIAQHLASHPQMQVDELHEWIRCKIGVSYSKSTVSQILRRLKR